ncbi:hypothetical protein FRB95_001633 [Tulasnella sp. JGI-2019a]|nr:hypothetical protein FRB95_001633 [Tulasnella sp. JGI-2019a]
MEIRLQMLKELNAEDLSAALVCKLWSGLAIDTAWRNLSIPLSWLLASLTNYPASVSQICRDSESLPHIPDPSGRLGWTIRAQPLVPWST